MGRIINLEELTEEITKLKFKKDKIILAGGCFDILHSGHIEFLQKAKNLNGKLIILLESDETIKKLKGQNRPVNTQKDRALIISSLEMVDYVVLLPLLQADNDYLSLVKKIKPDIIAITKNDPKKKEKEFQTKLVNGKLIEVIDKKEDYSTTNIVERLILNKQL